MRLSVPVQWGAEGGHGRETETGLGVWSLKGTYPSCEEFGFKS